MKKPTVTACNQSDSVGTTVIEIRRIVSLSQIVEMDLPKPAPVVDRLLQPGEITLMIGRQKEGKSTLTLQLAIDIGGGDLFLDEYATRTGKVLYLDFENRLLQVQKRALDLSKNRGSLANVEVKIYERASAIHRDLSLSGDGAIRLKDEISERKPDVLIIDPLRYAAPDKGNKGEEAWALAVIDAVVKIQQVHPLMSVLLVHHLRKSSEDAGPTLRDDPPSWIEKCYGSQALLAHVDSIWGLARESEGYTFATVSRSHEQLTVRLEKEGPETERFALCDDRLESLSPEQRAHWDKLPSKFTWKMGLERNIAKGSLNRLIELTKGLGLLRHENKQYFKVESPGRES